MTSQPVSDASPGTVLFPEYATLYALLDAEVRDLTDEQLDFRSDEWGWADWSIRVQLSHMAALIPQSGPASDELLALAALAALAARAIEARQAAGAAPPFRMWGPPNGSGSIESGGHDE